MRAWGGAVVVVMLASGCQDDSLVDGRFDALQWQYLQTLRRTDPAQPTDSDEAELGKAVFFDTGYSDEPARERQQRRAEVSCASCHATPWFADVGHAVSEPITGLPTGRNTIALVDLADQPGPFTWDGRIARAEDVLYVPLNKMRSSEAALAHTIVTKYSARYVALFGAIPWIDAATPDAHAICDNVAKALVAYEKQLVTGQAPFDRYLSGDDFAALSEQAKDGLELFIGDAMCSECHTGQNFADGEFHNTGVPGTDRGRAGITTMDPCTGITDCDPAALEGAFRTPMLRNVAMTRPYMHRGQFATLGEVVDFYWHGPSGGSVGTPDRNLHDLSWLTVEDRAALVAFLESLTSEPVDPDRYR